MFLGKSGACPNCRRRLTLTNFLIRERWCSTCDPWREAPVERRKYVHNPVMQRRQRGRRQGEKK